MKKEDLMIGDWIMYKSDSPKKAFPVKVTAEMFTVDLVRWYDRFEYIPLKDEIYKANNLTNPDGRFIIFDTDNWYFRVGEWMKENSLNVFFTPHIFCSSIIYFETEHKTQEEILNIVIKEGFKYIDNTTRFSFLFDSQYIVVDKSDGYTRVEIRMPNFEKF